MKAQKLTYRDLSTMAKKALAKERAFIEADDTSNALRYSAIWFRIFKAMSNPYYFYDNTTSDLLTA